MTIIVKSRTVEGEYYINGERTTLGDWGFWKRTTVFTDEEKKQFDNYIKSYNLN